MREILCVCALSFVATGCVVTVTGDARALPQRPTFSVTTDTVPEGEIQVEAGLTVDPGDRLDTPMTIRYGRSDVQEFFASWSPYQKVDLRGDDKQGAGDLVLGIRERVLEETDEQPSVSWGAAVKLPTGREADTLSSGETDFLASGSVTKQVDDWRVTGFYQLGLLGEQDGGDMNIEHGLAIAAVGREQHGVMPFGELSGIFDIEADSDRVVGLLGVYRRLSSSLVLDAGIVFGLSEDAENFAFFVGVTHGVGYATRLRDYRQP